jgi:hypothetical protein
MAKIVDPDFLSLDVDGTPTTEEVAIVTAAKTIELRVAGSLSDASPGSGSGVTKQCLYSFLKEEWKSNSVLNKFKFPIKAIYEAKFIMQYGWSFANAQTRDLIRDAGWQEIDGSEYACIISLGSQYDDTQQANYQQVAGFDQNVTNFDKTGPLDEPIQIYDGGSNDYRDFLKVFLRMWQRTYSDYNLLTEQGYSALTYIAYRLPLSNADDIKNTGTTEAYIDTAVDPYQDMELQYYTGQLFETAAAQSYVADDVVQDGAGRWARCTSPGTVVSPGGAWASFGGTSSWEAYPGERQIGANYYAFNRAVQYNGVATEPDDSEIYKFCQQRLRKSSNINDDPETDGYGTVNGEVAVRLCYYVGDTLHSWPGVCFDNFNSNITNDIVLHDITVDGGGLDSEDVPVTSGDQTYPFVAAGTMVFSSNLVNETNADTLYRMYFRNVRSQSGNDVSISGASGAAATINSTALVDFSNLTTNDHFYVSGFLANPANNGLKKATAPGAATSIAYTDTLGRTQVNESAGDTVTVEEKPFDSVDAIVVNDNGSSPIQGQITQQNISFDFDYDNNVQGGRDSGEDAPVVIVAQGLNDSEWVFAEFTITANTGLSFPINAPDERTYLNPAGGPTTTSSTTTTAP